MLVWHKDCFYCHSCMDGVGEGSSLLPCEHILENHDMDIGTYISARASFDYLTEGELEKHLHDMQIELENLAWDRKELQEHLHTAIDEQRMMELILAELEGEHDKAIAKVELPVSELHDLRTENLRLKEIQGKGYWNNKGRDQTGNAQSTAIRIPSLKSCYDGSGFILQDLLMHKDTQGDESKTKMELLKILRNEPISTGPIHPVMPEISLRSFSAVLSLVVGMIVWRAEDPCMPLIVALFSVVGMSLKSVVQFFSTIKNRPASDAVALLSFNWFILGTLTYPTLPKVAHTVVLVALNFVDGALSWLGFSFFLAQVCLFIFIYGHVLYIDPGIRNGSLYIHRLESLYSKGALHYLILS